MSVGSSPLSRELTVANVRDDQAGDVDVVFLESARFFRLPRDHPRFDELLGLLLGAKEEQRLVRVGVSAVDAGRIEEVELLDGR